MNFAVMSIIQEIIFRVVRFHKCIFLEFDRFFCKEDILFALAPEIIGYHEADNNMGLS